MSEAFPPLTDFNDLAATEGLEAVRAQVAEAMEAPPLEPPLEPEAAPAPAWPQPLTGATSAPDIPADTLPGWLGRYVDALALATQVPSSMVVGFALSVVAAAVQRRYVVSVHDGYTESASFWSLTSAASGSRKSAVVKALARPLTEWERYAQQRMRREIAITSSRIGVAEATIKRLQAQAGKTDDSEERERLRKLIEQEENDMPERIYSPLVFTGDATVEAVQNILVEQGGRASVLAAEGGLFSALTGTYGSKGGPALDVVLEGYSGGDVRVHRAGREAYISRAAVTLGLMLQPDLLAEAAGSSRFRASGLMARFAYCVPRPFVGGRDVRRFTSVPDEVEQEYARRMDELLGDCGDGPHKQPTVVPLDGQARECWFDFSQEVENGLAEGGALAALPDWGAKLAGMAARVALLFELVTSGPNAQAISVDTMGRSIALCRLLVPHAQAGFRLLAADQADRDADHILNWLRAGDHNHEVRQSDVHQAMRSRFTKGERLQIALARLQANGCIRRETRRNEGARPSVWILINPGLFIA